MKDKSKFDVIIVGGSYSGLAAAMALGRALKKVLVIDGGKPCNAQTPHSHNFLTQDGNTPASIAVIGKEQVGRYSTVSFLNGLAVRGMKKEDGFEIRVDSGASFYGSKLIFAAGIRDVLPDIKGLAECWGISVLHCPYCHGYEVRNEPTGILGNGNTGFEMVQLISNWTSDLILFTNGTSTLTKEQASILKNHRIEVVEKKIDLLEHKNGYIEHIAFKDGTKAPLKAIYSRNLFEQHSTIPESLGCVLTEDGYIKVDGGQETNIAGVFACGDSTARVRTVANAVATGTTAGMMASKKMIIEAFNQD